MTADRMLGHGATLGEVGGDEVIELYEHAAVQRGHLSNKQSDTG